MTVKKHTSFVNDQERLVCFDFDGTLTPTNTLHQLFIIKFFYLGSIQRLCWIMKFLFQLPVFFLLYKLSSMKFNQFLYLQYAGMDESRVKNIVGKRLVPYLRRKLYPQAEEIIDAALRSDSKVIVVSASWYEIVYPAVSQLGVKTCLATELISNNGRLTGKFRLLVDGKAKAELIHQYVSTQGRNFTQIAAYGNSRWDIPMLALADKSYVINPDRRLSSWARQHHSQVLCWRHPPLHWSVYVLYPIASLILSNVKGLENIPKHGGCVVIANHSSYLDHFVLYTVIAAYVRRRLKFVAKQEHFKSPLISKVIARFGAYPINRQRGGRTALAKTVELVNKGEIVVVYPEGTRSRDGRIGTFKPGVLYVQSKTSCRIVPVGIKGAFDMWPPSKYIPRPGKISLQIDEPIAEWPNICGENISILAERKCKLAILQRRVEYMS